MCISGDGRRRKGQSRAQPHGCAGRGTGSCQAEVVRSSPLKWVVAVSALFLVVHVLFSLLFITYTTFPQFCAIIHDNNPVALDCPRAIWSRSAALPIMFVSLHTCSPSSFDPALAPGPRPNPVRRDTDIILSYYQSDLPGQSVPSSYTVSQNEASVPRIPRARSASTTSSVSVYSPDSSPATSHKTLEEETSPEHHSSDLASSRSGHQRRPSNLSEGGSDKRRVQIVEFQSHPPSSSCPTESNSNKGQDETKNRPKGPLTRRELNSRGLALVMPPDASPESFTGIITPLTAPPAGSTPLVGHEGAHGQHRAFGDGHQRSASEASKPTGNKTLHHKSSSRDIGIVGTLPKAEPRHDSVQQTVSPIFQTPVTPTAPSAAPSAPPASEPMAANPARFTMPTIGERTLSGDSTSSSSYSNPSPTLGADRSIPSMSFSSADPSSYLYYEPGRHSKAGPLPPPPRAMFNIDASSAPPPRPPRMRSPSPIRSRTALEITSRNFASTPPLTSKRSTSSFPHRDSGTSTEPSPRQPVRDVTNTPE